MLSLQQALNRGVLVFDGAMGTEIYRHHVFTNRSFDELCLSEPKLIRRIHTDYRDAGADVLTTNTFGANRVALAKFGLAEKLQEIRRAGARLAREVADAADRPMFVAGSIGPLPAQPQYEATVEEMIVEQVRGPDGRRGRLHPLRDAAEPAGAGTLRGGHAPAARTCPSCFRSPWSATARRPRANRSSGCWPRLPAGCAAADRLGHELRHRARRAARRGRAGRPADAAAAGRAAQRRHAQGSREPPHLFLFARVSGRIRQAIRGLGVSAVGGCCGTTPDHIREVARPSSRCGGRRCCTVAAGGGRRAENAGPAGREIATRARLAGRQWVATVELLPPRGYDLRRRSTRPAALARSGASTRSTSPTARGPARGSRRS